MKIFTSVAQMKLAHLVQGQLVRTLGYFIRDDGGQGLYYIDPAYEEVDDLSDHELANGAFAVLQHNNLFNVLQYGANSVLNSAPNFEAARDDAPSDSPVFVPEGTYEITGTVTGNFFSIGPVTIDTGTVNIIRDLMVSAPSVPNLQDGDYTLLITDAEQTIHKASGDAGETVTIPSNASVAFPLGTMICFQNEGGDDLSIAINSDTLTGNDGIPGTKTLGDEQTAVAHKLTATTWKYSASDA
jgi:hypothetical protein